MSIYFLALGKLVTQNISDLGYKLTTKTFDTLPILKIVLESGTSLFVLLLTPTPPDFRVVPL